MARLLQWVRDRIVYSLLAVILILSGTVAWLLFQPDQRDMEWRTVNEQMEQALAESGAGGDTGSGTGGKGSTDSKPTSDATSNTDDQQVTWPLNLNKATADQLDMLPGIGPSKAQAILDLRNKLGSFTSVEQLLDVKGIGPKTLDKFRDKVSVGK